jgi:hypothetical protein
MGIEIKVPIEKLRERKLFVAVPMYGGQCAGMFARSVADLSALCTHYGIQVRFYFLFNESLITRARNYCADEFVRSGDTHLMFIDSDIGFNANDVIALMALQSENPDEDQYDIIAGPYPKKCISWEKIKMAVDKGAADEEPNNLEKFVGDYVFNPVQGNGSIPLGEPVEVLEAGTGFMMIRRNTFLKFMEAYPQQSYRPDHVRTEHFDGSREIFAFFDTPIDGKRTNLNLELKTFLDKNPDATHDQIMQFVVDPNVSSFRDYSKRYLSEDYMFCQWVRNIGLKVWFCPWIQLQHVGMYVFGGSLADLASIGASATADIGQLKKNKLAGPAPAKDLSQLAKFKKR